MTPQFEQVTLKRRDSDGSPYELRYIVHRESARCYGHVETPTKDRIMFEATPYGGKYRSYIQFEAAWSYLEECALKTTVEETEEAAKAIVGKGTNVERVDQTIAFAVDRICSQTGKEEGSE